MRMRLACAAARVTRRPLRRMWSNRHCRTWDCWMLPIHDRAACGVRRGDRSQWPNRQHSALRMALSAWQEVSAQRLERSGTGRAASEHDAPNRHAPDAVIAVTFVAPGCCLKRHWPRRSASRCVRVGHRREPTQSHRKTFGTCRSSNHDVVADRVHSTHSRGRSPRMGDWNRSASASSCAGFTPALGSTHGSVSRAFSACGCVAVAQPRRAGQRASSRNQRATCGAK